MFLVGDISVNRENRIRNFLSKEDCAIAVLLSAAHFEWTVSRGILALGVTPTKALRERLRSYYGLDKYKELWADEVIPNRSVERLSVVIRNWSFFKEHFKLRDRLIHGRTSCSINYAEPRVNSILQASSDVFSACLGEGVDLHNRLKTRRKARQ